MQDKTAKLLRNVRHEMQERGAFTVEKLNERYERRPSAEQAMGQVAVLTVIDHPQPQNDQLDLPLAS